MSSRNEMLRMIVMIYGGEGIDDGYAHATGYPCYLEGSRNSREYS
jgi:hypothetical protein